MLKFDKQYFINKFESLPEDRWIEDWFYNEDKTKFCALGHCGSEPANEFKYIHTDEAHALIKLLPNITMINDGVKHYSELGSSARERVLRALRALND